MRVVALVAMLRTMLKDELVQTPEEAVELVWTNVRDDGRNWSGFEVLGPVALDELERDLDEAVGRVRQQNQKRLNLKRELRDHRRKAHQQGIVEEYIGEAEHQDGEAYWDRFPTLAELLKDFDLYVAARED